ncbi:hypothetical protein BD410DRAFT_113782 [Rickenella mellea]|uniref:Uncharacterized protein n=1 Tax=Rickenella mellea TaxID=50990 RepID=A0A4Y7QAB6_9AGAM|nr:hypothetical protein BD410DRAFT_113782 [Rickenella mellea]
MPTMRRPSTSTLQSPPQLPVDLLQELSRNPDVGEWPYAHSESKIDAFRDKIVHREVPVDHIWPIEGLSCQRSLLQIAASAGSLHLVYEMIRLGANINITDEYGRTPLFVAVQALTMMDRFPDEPRPPKVGPRTSLVASLLIEQHADVNVTGKFKSCFTMLMGAKVKRWDLIELLIAHGAHEVLEFRDGPLLSEEEKEYISELLRTRPSKRPPRRCPCFSGHLLSDCHGEGPKPFPYHFMCPCQSGSSYAKCCKKRKVSWRDIWNEDRGIIEPWRKDLPVYLPLPYDTITIWFTLRDQDVMTSLPIEKFRRPTDIPLAVAQTGIPPELGNEAIWDSCFQDVSRKGSVDPAFVFAMKMVSWNARPLGRKVPKNYAMDLARIFNEHVDSYIASGQDSRPKLAIEIAAKLGPSCGALYRICEAERCNKQEGRHLQTLKYCQECRMQLAGGLLQCEMPACSLEGS